VKLACSSMLVPSNSFREKLTLLERCGYEGVEIRLLESEATPERVAEIEGALAESPIRACALVFPGPAYQLTFDSEDAKRAKLANAKKALEIGARLGAPVFVTPEYQPRPLTLFYAPKPLDDLERESFSGFLGEIAEYAEKVSAIALLEPINRYETHFYYRLEDVMTVCDQVGSKRIKIVADFFHMNIEERDIAASIKKAAGYIYHVQLADSNRLLPGQGHTDFRPGFAALGQIGYDRYMALECRIPNDPERDLAQSVQYLRQCLEDSYVQTRALRS